MRSRNKNCEVEERKQKHESEKWGKIKENVWSRKRWNFHFFFFFVFVYQISNFFFVKTNVNWKDENSCFDSLFVWLWFVLSAFILGCLVFFNFSSNLLLIIMPLSWINVWCACRFIERVFRLDQHNWYRIEPNKKKMYWWKIENFFCCCLNNFMLFDLIPFEWFSG